MAEDRFADKPGTLEAPAGHADAVTPSDSEDLPFVSRALYVGGAGDIVVDMITRGVAVSFIGVPVGTILPIRTKRVRATGTTATNIVSLY